jgi:hypothetical protein
VRRNLRLRVKVRISEFKKTQWWLGCRARRGGSVGEREHVGDAFEAQQDVFLASCLPSSGYMAPIFIVPKGISSQAN